MRKIAIIVEIENTEDLHDILNNLDYINYFEIEKEEEEIFSTR